MPNNLPSHSPLGASGASRWMRCPGSVQLSSGVSDPESEFAAVGTAAHTLSQHCLEQDMDAWELIDQHAEINIVVDKDMADAVQVYLNAVRSTHPDRGQSNSFIERGFHCPEIHELFYGTSDFTYVDTQNRALHVWDYKHGAGIVVDVKENPQCMYYGVGMLEDLDLWQKVDKVVLHIAQPRGFHSDGPLRHWTISTVDLEKWLDDELLPAMDRAQVSRETESGEHCRFCPARYRACPQMLKDFDELEEIMTEMEGKGGAKELSNEQIGRFLTLFDVAKIAAKAASETAFTRMQAGKKVPGRKLANARTNRTWKDGAEAAVKKKFGKDAFTEPTLKTPAKIDALPEGGALTARWAYKPDGGLTVVAEKDTRAAVNKDTKSLFKDHTKEKK